MLNRLYDELSRRTWPAALWTLLVVIACLLPAQEVPQPPVLPGFDKIVHAGLFFAGTLLWRLRFPSHTVTIALAGAGLGILIEFWQEWLNMGRSFDWWDAVADGAGVACGLLFVSFFLRRKG